jgi:hypothetical protein
MRLSAIAVRCRVPWRSLRWVCKSPTGFSARMAITRQWKYRFGKRYALDSGEPERELGGGNSSPYRQISAACFFFCAQ